MGFLSEGNVLPWEEAKKYANYIRQQGILQFLNIYKNAVTRNGDSFKWGDEVEYMLLRSDHQQKSSRLLLKAASILKELQEEERLDPQNARTLWRPEYGSFMVEGTPGKPYDQNLSSLLEVEVNMKLRRELVEQLLGDDEFLLSITSYPMMGVNSFTEPAPPSEWKPESDPYARSSFIQDQIINTHPRFPFLSANIRKRRGKKVDINVPLFQDANTKEPQYGPVYSYDPTETDLAPPPGALPNHIYMDAMAFGMGCCCLQCTFQCSNIRGARYLYDQFAVLTPIMLALTAAAPIFRGYLAETDVRWNVISSSVDDRTEEERGLKPLVNDRFKIGKSRYASISLYISEDERLKDEYNDLDVAYDADIFAQLQQEGIDARLAKHISHLFIRDPLVIYDNKIEIDNNTHSDHFENIQSTNWQTVRFKPPPPNSDIGWRVEFRSMEAQLTDFENAAFASFVALLARVIPYYQLDLYLPISKVDENMETAHKRNAVLDQKFWFRKPHTGLPAPEYVQLSVHEIVNGKEGVFEGLIPLIRVYLDTARVDDGTRALLDNYLAFVSKRASGELITTAAWIRNFVRSHPAYKHDSVVTHEINYDLMEACKKITHGQLRVPELLDEILMNNHPRQHSHCPSSAVA